MTQTGFLASEIHIWSCLLVCITANEAEGRDAEGLLAALLEPTMEQVVTDSFHLLPH